MAMQMRIIHFLVLAALISVCHSRARPYKDSPIRTIIVPYYSSASYGNRNGQPYQFPIGKTESRHVRLPETMELVPQFHLRPGAMALGSQKGAALNFADGAYPVYYMPSNANGRFNGKISLLV